MATEYKGKIDLAITGETGPQRIIGGVRNVRIDYKDGQFVLTMVLAKNAQILNGNDAK